MKSIEWRTRRKKRLWMMLVMLRGKVAVSMDL